MSELTFHGGQAVKVVTELFTTVSCSSSSWPALAALALAAVGLPPNTTATPHKACLIQRIIAPPLPCRGTTSVVASHGHELSTHS